jgi:hypothetical protein
LRIFGFDGVNAEELEWNELDDLVILMESMDFREMRKTEKGALRVFNT